MKRTSHRPYWKLSRAVGHSLPRNSKRVSFGGVKLDSVRITQREDSGKVVVQRTDNISTMNQWVFRRLQVRFVDRTFDQVVIVVDLLYIIIWKKEETNKIYSHYIFPSLLQIYYIA